MKEQDKQFLIMVLMMIGVIIAVLSFNVCGIMYSSSYTQIGIQEAISKALADPLNMKAYSTAFAHMDYTTGKAGSVILVYALAASYFYMQEVRNHYGNLGTAKFEENTAKYTNENAFKKDKKDKTDSDANLILGKGLKCGLKEGDNVNVLIIGGAGSGKSFGVIKPNILQMSTTYVVTDPSGEIFRALGKGLMEHGYNVKVFSTSDMEHSHVYNPFDYVYDEEGIVDETKVLSMVSMFQKNAADLKGKGGGDPFWDKSAKALLLACSMYLIEFCDERERNFYSMLKLVQAGKTNEDAGSSSQTALDIMFENARKKDPTKHCFSSYDTFKLAPAKTANSILISAAVDLNFFNQTKVRNMTTTAYKVKQRNEQGKIISFVKENGQLVRTEENIDLRKLGDEKTALFVNIPQADGTFNFLVSMMYSQLFDTLYGRAEKLCPRKWMIKDKLGNPIISMIDSEDDANKFKELYLNATVEADYDEDDKENITGWFIKNKDADKKFSMPGYPVGYLKKVYSEEVGKSVINDVKDNSYIEKGKGRLPWHVQCLLDEFANIGEIPEFPQKLATSRKYEISAMVVLQSKAQLENKYDKLAGDIMSNCDFTVFLGSGDPDTCKYISERLGDKTEVIKTSAAVGNKKGQASTSTQKRALLDPAEVSKIKKNESIVFARKQVFRIKKFNCATHLNFKYSGDNRGKKIFWLWKLLPWVKEEKVKNYNLNISEFVTCSEKSVEDSRTAPAETQAKKNQVNNRTATGNRSYKRNDVKTASDVKGFISGAASSSNQGYRNKANKQLAAEKETKVTSDGKSAEKTAQEIDADEIEMHTEDIMSNLTGKDLGIPTEVSSVIQEKVETDTSETVANTVSGMSDDVGTIDADEVEMPF